MFSNQDVTPVGISKTLNTPDYYDNNEDSFIYQSIHIFQRKQQRQEIVSRNKRLSSFTTLLLLCGDIESCPGLLDLSEFCNVIKTSEDFM